MRWSMTGTKSVLPLQTGRDKDHSEMIRRDLDERGNNMRHAQRLPCRADCEGPTRRCSGTLLLLAIASLVVACGDTSSSWGSATFTGSGSANLAWNAVTAPAGLAGYKVYYGTAPRVYGPGLSVGITPSYQVMGLSSGTTYYFAVTALDSQGYESLYSNEASKAIP